MTLNEVKRTIMKTECKMFLCDGLTCSEPMLTRDEKGLIDNFFIYSSNREKTEFSKPIIIFGIYAELCEIAYIKECPENRNMIKGIKLVENDSLFDSFRRYSEIYPYVREVAFTDCNENDKKKVLEYYDCFKSITNNVVWNYYKEVAPQFIEWVESL